MSLTDLSVRTELCIHVTAFFAATSSFPATDFLIHNYIAFISFAIIITTYLYSPISSRVGCLTPNPITNTGVVSFSDLFFHDLPPTKCHLHMQIRFRAALSITRPSIPTSELIRYRIQIPEFPITLLLAQVCAQRVRASQPPTASIKTLRPTFPEKGIARMIVLHEALS